MVCFDITALLLYQEQEVIGFYMYLNSENAHGHYLPQQVLQVFYFHRLVKAQSTGCIKQDFMVW